jgi:hypothetical protein
VKTTRLGRTPRTTTRRPTTATKRRPDLRADVDRRRVVGDFEDPLLDGAATASKTAVILVTGPTTSEHRGLSAHAPRHPMKREPLSGSATNVCRSPNASKSLQMSPQSIDLLRTVPDPVPFLATRN